MSRATESQPQLNRLSGWERFWCVAIALVLFIFTACLHTWPPHQTTTERASDGSWKHTEAPLDMSHFNIGACAFSAVLLLYAINGLRVVRFSAGNVTVDTQPEEEAQRTIDHITSVDPSADQQIDPEVELPKSTATPEIVQTAKGQFKCYKLSEVPAQVLRDAITDWPADNLPPKDFTDFMFALQKTGRGNHPWVIKLRDRIPVVVSYGGQGKLKATVTKA